MKGLYFALLVASISLNAVFGCTTNKAAQQTTKAPTQATTESATEATEGASTAAATTSGGAGNALEEFVGPDAKSSPYDDSGYEEAGGGPVTSSDELNCNFDNGPCCYQNEETDQLDWMVGEGPADTETLKKNFELEQIFSKEDPGKFLWTGSVDPAPGQEAQLKSCSVGESHTDATVKFDFMKTAGTKLEVCTKGLFDAADDLVNCQEVTGSSPATITLPPGELFDIVFVASGFDNGGLVAIDDITVDYDSSAPTTAAPEDTTAGATTANPANAGNCKSAACEFGDQHCEYTTILEPSDSAPSQPTFQRADKQYGNSDTGVPPVPEGKETYFGAVKVKGGQSATLTSGGLSFTGPTKIKFGYYEATAGLALSMCVNDLTDCTPVSDEAVDASHRAWQTTEMPLPATTKKVIFYAQNTGSYIGYVGVDAITLLSDTSGDNLCPTPSS